MERVILSEFDYPQGRDVKFEFFDQPLSVYEGKISITLSLKLSKKYPPGKDTLVAKLRVQACNDKVCLAPSTIDILVPIEVIKPRGEGTPFKGDSFSRFPTEPNISPEANVNETRGHVNEITKSNKS